MMDQNHAEATSIHALPARMLERGFRFLLLREYPTDGRPSAFAFIDQSLMRSPERSASHGLWFAGAFLPDIVAWLSDELGHPSLHDDAGKPYRNPRWPRQDWRPEERRCPDGARTVEWSIEVTFDDDRCRARFQRRWGERLRGAPPKTAKASA
jgi:hypothetical protein